MARFLARKTPLLTLRPLDDEGRSMVADLKPDETVTVEIKRARNPRQHRLFWALVSLIYDNQERYTTREQLADALKCAVGWCDEIELKDGRVMALPKSISYANMKNEDFKVFLDKVIALTVEKILPSVAEADLRRELEEMVG